MREVKEIQENKMENNNVNIDSNKANESYLRAKNKTAGIKKFYKHLIIYIVVNIIISIVKIMDYMTDYGYTFEEAFFQLDTFITWAIWGFFVLLQAVKTFKKNAFLGADWEEKKIQEIMNQKKR
jgi:hypothetical protein